VYLPAWIVIAIVWQTQIWVLTNVVLVLVVHILFGPTLASWSFFAAAPFGKSPQLASVWSTFLALMLAIVALILKYAFTRIPRPIYIHSLNLRVVSTGGAYTFTVIFLPSFYIHLREPCDRGFENHNLPRDAVKGDPDHNIMLFPMIVAGTVRAANSSRVDPHRDFPGSTYSYGRSWRISSSAACMMPEGRRLRGRGSSGVAAKPQH
jgi:hypothetical protein